MQFFTRSINQTLLKQPEVFEDSARGIQWPRKMETEKTDTVKRDISKKREDYLNWDDYFMAVAFLSAMRSKDPCSQVGACIVNSENKIVGIGYNGMPIGCSDDEFPWRKDSGSKVENKYFYVCHAEMNAILNKIVGELRGCRIYVAMFPCNECAKLIIQSGIKAVYYLSNKNWDKDECVATRRMFDSAGIKYTQYSPTSRQIVIDFDSIDWNKVSQEPPTPKKTRKVLQESPSK